MDDVRYFSFGAQEAIPPCHVGTVTAVSWGPVGMELLDVIGASRSRCY